MKSIFFFLVLFILNDTILYSQTGLSKTAQSTMNFLLVSTSSRAAGMGDAFTTIGKGAESVFYNPAGLTETNYEFDINLNYTQWIANINYLSGAAAWNIGDYGVVGINLITIDYGKIKGTSLLLGELSDSYIDNGDIQNVGAYCVGLSYAKAISNEFTIGGTIKLAGQNLGQSIISTGLKENNATKLAFDAGVIYRTGFKGFTFGMSIRNFATNIKREEIDEQLPLVFSLGSSINVVDIIDTELATDNLLLFAVDFLHQNNYSERFNFGLEYTYSDMFSLRGGYQTNRDLASWSGGVGFHTNILSYNVEFNYSYSVFEFFNDVNRISIAFSF